MQSTTSSTRTFMTPSPITEKPKTKKRPHVPKRVTKKNMPWLIIVVLVLISGFLFWQYHQAQNKLQISDGTASSQQVSQLINKVRRLAVLPASETPTVATVVHADKLRSQSFFVNAQDGDKVLVYSKEKEAILYRPSTNQIVTIAPVNVTSTGSTNLSNQ